MMAFPLGIPITFCMLQGHHHDGIQICPSDLPRQGILQLGNWKMGKLNCLGLFDNLWYRKKILCLLNTSLMSYTLEHSS